MSVAESRARQGLPPHVTDPLVLHFIARILRGEYVGPPPPTSAQIEASREAAERRAARRLARRAEAAARAAADERYCAERLLADAQQLTPAQIVGAIRSAMTVTKPR